MAPVGSRRHTTASQPVPTIQRQDPGLDPRQPVSFAPGRVRSAYYPGASANDRREAHSPSASRATGRSRRQRPWRDPRPGSSGNAGDDNRLEFPGFVDRKSWRDLSAFRVVRSVRPDQSRAASHRGSALVRRGEISRARRLPGTNSNRGDGLDSKTLRACRGPRHHRRAREDPLDVSRIGIDGCRGLQIADDALRAGDCMTISPSTRWIALMLLDRGRSRPRAATRDRRARASTRVQGRL